MLRPEDAIGRIKVHYIKDLSFNKPDISYIYPKYRGNGTYTT